MSIEVALLILAPLTFLEPQMDQTRKKAEKVDQFLYQDRWVDKANFRAFVYDKNGNQKLASSYPEFETLTTSGIWYASKLEPAPLPSKKEKQNDSVRAVS